jgi:hypothetical protein
MFLGYVGAWSSMPKNQKLHISYHQEAEYEPIKIPTMLFT